MIVVWDSAKFLGKILVTAGNMLRKMLVISSLNNFQLGIVKDR